MGSKNHEIVPTPIIAQISGTRSGVHRCISALAKVGLIAKVKNAKYDGYRLTYGGLDYLALNTHRKSSTIFSLGNQIGVGKESDIYVVASDTGSRLVLKIHRLGRISFRTVKANRDYLRNRASGSWMYLSRLAAMKEYAFMQVLRREGFPVPEPVGQSRHTVVMEFIDSFPLRQIDSVPNPAKLYAELMELIVRLARVGLIHGDFNEFNILIKEERVASGKKKAAPKEASEPQQESEDAPKADPSIKLTPILIDFPQMLSTTHTNAAFYFDRDVACVKRFFLRRFKYESDEPGPFFADAIKGSDLTKRLDVEVEATGFSRKMAKELEKYIEAVGIDNEQEGELGEQDEEVEYEDDENEEDDEVENDEEAEDHDIEQEEIPEDPQVDDPKLAEELGGLTLKEKLELRDREAGLTPLEISYDPEVIAERVHAKKKASGWAI